MGTTHIVYHGQHCYCPVCRTSEQLEQHQMRVAQREEDERSRKEKKRFKKEMKRARKRQSRNFTLALIGAVITGVVIVAGAAQALTTTPTPVIIRTEPKELP